MFNNKWIKNLKKDKAFANSPSAKLIELGLTNGAEWKKCVHIVSEKRGEVCDILETGIIPQLQTVLRLLETAIPCKEFQLMLQDTESLMMNLQDLKNNGPSAPFVEKPIEESEISENAPENVLPLGKVNE